MLAGVSVARQRSEQELSIIIDAGTACTVDVISPASHFMGGAILPGINMSAKALHQFTEALPLVSVDQLQQPEPIGSHTESAIISGLYWGLVGGLKELTDRIASEYEMQPVIYLSGGAGKLFLPHSTYKTNYQLDLVLTGIGIIASQSANE